MEDKRITIFVGEFGSGKTEIAVNYALQLQQTGQATAIVDMDLIKPYFRTRENRELLENSGVKVIAPDPRLSHADLPIMPHNLIEILAQTTTRVVMDAGGGESAIALGQLNGILIKAAIRPCWWLIPAGLLPAMRKASQTHCSGSNRFPASKSAGWSAIPIWVQKQRQPIYTPVWILWNRPPLP